MFPETTEESTPKEPWGRVCRHLIGRDILCFQSRESVVDEQDRFFATRAADFETFPWSPVILGLRLTQTEMGSFTRPLLVSGG